jgi:hypothetical protein
LAGFGNQKSLSYISINTENGIIDWKHLPNQTDMKAKTRERKSRIKALTTDYYIGPIHSFNNGRRLGGHG